MCVCVRPSHKECHGSEIGNIVLGKHSTWPLLESIEFGDRSIGGKEEESLGNKECSLSFT